MILGEPEVWGVEALGVAGRRDPPRGEDPSARAVGGRPRAARPHQAGVRSTPASACRRRRPHRPTAPAGAGQLDSATRMSGAPSSSSSSSGSSSWRPRSSRSASACRAAAAAPRPRPHRRRRRRRARRPRPHRRPPSMSRHLRPNRSRRPSRSHAARRSGSGTGWARPGPCFTGYVGSLTRPRRHRRRHLGRARGGAAPRRRGRAHDDPRCSRTCGSGRPRPGSRPRRAARPAARPRSSTISPTPTGRSHASAGEPNVWLFVGRERRRQDHHHRQARPARGRRRAARWCSPPPTRSAPPPPSSSRTGATGSAPTVVRGQEGADPGSVVFDAMSAAAGRGGRPRARRHRRAAAHQGQPDGGARRRSAASSTARPGALQEVLLVLDATTGQNGLVQARAVRARRSASPASCSPSSTAPPRAASCSPSRPSSASR